MLLRERGPERGRFRGFTVAQCNGALATNLGGRVLGKLFDERDQVHPALAGDAQAGDPEVAGVIFERGLHVAGFLAFDAGEQVQRAGTHPGFTIIPNLLQVALRFGAEIPQRRPGEITRGVVG